MTECLVLALLQSFIDPDQSLWRSFPLPSRRVDILRSGHDRRDGVNHGYIQTSHNNMVTRHVPALDLSPFMSIGCTSIV